MYLSQLSPHKRQKFVQVVDTYTGIGLLTASKIFFDPPRCTVMEFLIENAFVQATEIPQLVNWIESGNSAAMPLCGLQNVDIDLTEEEITQALLACAVSKLGIEKEKIASAGITFNDVFGLEVSYPATASISIELNNKE